MELHERADGLIVVNDAYNANPASMVAAIEALTAIGRRRSRRTVAVLGEMKELGAEADDAHREVGRAAAEAGRRRRGRRRASRARHRRRARHAVPGWTGRGRGHGGA